VNPKLKSFLKSDAGLILGIILLSAIPRIFLLLVTHRFSNDGISYLSIVLYLREPGLFDETPKRIYMILYPFLTMILDFALRDLVLSARIINIFIGLSIPPVAFILGRKLISRNVGIIAAIFCAVNPSMIEQSVETRGDNLFVLLTLVSIYVFESLDWFKPKVRDSLLLALMIGLTQLTRTNGVMYLLVVIPIWLYWVMKGKIDRKEFLVKTLIPFVLLFIMISSVPQILLYKRGYSMPSMFIYTYLDGNIAALHEREDIFFKLNESATESQFVEDVRKADFSTIIRDIDILPQKYARNFVYLLRLMFDPVIELLLRLSLLLLPLLFYMFYYWGEIETPRSLRRLLFWAWPSFFILPAINIENLYFLPWIPVVMILLAWLIMTVSKLGILSRFGVIVISILLLVVLIPSISSTGLFLKDEAKYKNPYLETGKWIKANTPDDSQIMARDPEIFFHSFRRGFRMPNEDLDRTLVYAKNKNINYMVFGPVEYELRRELFMSAYEEVYKKGRESRLEVVYSYDNHRDLVYVVKIRLEKIKPLDEESVTENEELPVK
jgi:hypothetical protein